METHSSILARKIPRTEEPGDVLKLLSLIRSHLFIFAFISNILEVGHRGSCCDLCRRVFCLCFPLGVL